MTSEGFESSRGQELFTEIQDVLQDFVEGKLPLNQVQETARGKVRSLTSDPNTWVSKTRHHEDGTADIVIGEQALPAATLRRWKWGTNTVEGQYIVKTAHEYAHLVERVFDGELLPWLDQLKDEVPGWAEPYLRLYGELAQRGPVTGLATESIYHEQSQRAGNLSMPAYEDMAELIGARMLGKNYFLFRMRKVNVALPPDSIENIGNFIDKIIQHYLQPARSQE